MSKKVLRTIIVAFIAMFFLTTPLVVNANPRKIDIYINDERIISDVDPVLKQSRVLVPLRVISEHFGALVHWEDSTKTVTVQMGPKVIKLSTRESKAMIDGREVLLDVPAQIVQSRTMVPLRFVGETLGSQVHWDDALGQVNISRQEANILDLRYENSSIGPSLVIEGDGPLRYNTEYLSKDKKLVIDIFANLETSDNALYIYDDFVDKVVAGKDSDNPNLTRLLVDLNKASVYEETNSNGGKTVKISFNNALSQIDFHMDEDQIVVDLETTTSIQINSKYLSEPDRLVLDMEDTILGMEAYDIPKNDFFKGLRLGQFSTSPNVTRVVFDLKENSNCQVFQDGTRTSVIFSPVSTLSDLKVSSQGNKSIVSFNADRDIGYEIETDKAKKQIIITVPATSIGQNFDESVQVKDGIIDMVKVVKTKVRNTYNAQIILGLNSWSSFELMTAPPSKHVELVVHKSLLKNKVIAIDPGHGGGDPGAVVGQIQEKTLNLGVAQKLKALLEAQGVQVIMVRDGDIGVDQYVRAGIANQANADAFISIHHNSAPSTSANGVETWYYPDSKKKALAQAIQRAVVQSTGARDRGIKESVGLIVTRETRMPSALLEVAFMTNPQDLSKAQNQEYQQKVAQGILQGILDYFRSSGF